MRSFSFRSRSSRVGGATGVARGANQPEPEGSESEKGPKLWRGRGQEGERRSGRKREVEGKKRKE
jgi:hypothetical protein